MLRARLAVLAIGCALFLGISCSNGDSDPAPSTSSTSTTSVGSSSTTSLPAGEVTIRGEVLAVSASARIIDLDEAVDGYSRIGLTGETEVTAADGSEGSIQDIPVGAVVEATGEPGASGAIIARLVVVEG